MLISISFREDSVVSVGAFVLQQLALHPVRRMSATEATEGEALQPNHSPTEETVVAVVKMVLFRLHVSEKRCHLCQPLRKIAPLAVMAQEASVASLTRPRSYAPLSHYVLLLLFSLPSLVVRGEASQALSTRAVVAIELVASSPVATADCSPKDHCSVVPWGVLHQPDEVFWDFLVLGAFRSGEMLPRAMMDSLVEAGVAQPVAAPSEGGHAEVVAMEVVPLLRFTTSGRHGRLAPKFG